MVAKSERPLVGKIKLSKGSLINGKTYIKERKIKKKLNKRQRSIKKKLKEHHLKKKKNSELSQPGDSENADIISPITSLTTPVVYDLKDPKNYSSNWEKLKTIMKENNMNNPRMKSKDCIKENKKIESTVNKKNINSKKLKSPNDNAENNILDENKKICYSLLNNETLSSNIKIVALDCEMVGGGFNGQDDILARVSIVDHNGSVLYDEHVKPQERVTDYRTCVSGIRPSDIKNAKSYSVVQKEVSDILDGSRIVGHALSNDFKCLLISPPRYMIRDTSKFKPFIKLFNGGTPGLKKLTAKVLGLEIQTGEHNSVEDAQAAMRLYMLRRKEFEDKYTKQLMRGKTKRSKSTKKKKANIVITES